ncbi:PREDICTED: EF-hand calcium-binding domain-containing protein 7, partial [Corvus brachyrhynchos]|uniref:EF-hand calcium-binding domain-containing protein 7 n=1 Tax=Corvus brachyrhynchos TaxID=85066 RepID=UPI00081641B9
LQQAGRNPSRRTINKYWTSQTTSLNFDDFCAILKKEKPATKNELLEAFGKIDTDKAGYIFHDELYKILTTRGAKMTWEEVTSITKQAAFNCSGKLDYNKVTAELLQDLHQLKVAKLPPPPLSLWVPAAAGTQS